MELLKYINKLSNGTSCSLLEPMTMSDFEKTKLIQKDPVACARYFNHKVSKLMSLLRDENGPFREHHVIDSYERIEFQNRGSSHEHIFLWLKDAPQYSENDVTSHELVISFIDKFITCQYDPENPFMGYLRHKHTFTCFKTNNDKKHCNCRFNYPLPVMPNTMILQPFPTEEREKWKEKYLAIKNFHHKL